MKQRHLVLAAGCLVALLAPGVGRGQSVNTNLWVANGPVEAVTEAGGVVYIGGSFTHVGPASGGGAPLDASTGSLPGSFPKVAGSVNAVAPDGAGGWFIGGAFTGVGGVARSNLAHVASNLTVTSWNPGTTDNDVYALAISGGTLYVGGNFSTLGGQFRSRIGAIDATTGIVSSWNPTASQGVQSLAVSGSTVYAGGDFTSIGGQSRNRIAALDATTGSATSWNPNANQAVLALVVSGSTVYAGGYFVSIGGQSRSFIAALDATTGNATAWNPNANGNVYDLAVSGSTVYVGGYFNNIGGQERFNVAALDATTGSATSWEPGANDFVNAVVVSGSTVYIGGNFTVVSDQARIRIAALDATTGAVTAWSPTPNATVNALVVSGTTVFAGGNFTSFGGVTRNRIAALDATTGVATAWNPNANGVVQTLAVMGSKVYAGGAFSTIGGQSRSRVAALDISTGLATSWNPNADDVVEALAVSGGTVYAGGLFGSIGGQSRSRIAALDAATGLATAWNPNANAYVYALAVSGGTVYAGGGFFNIGGQSRSRIAALDASTGLATAWNPVANNDVYTLAVGASVVYAGGIFTNIGGQSRNHIAALDASTGSATSWNPGTGIANAVAVSGTTVYLGGQTTSIGGVLRNNIGAVGAATGSTTAWNPDAGGPVVALTVRGSTIYAGGSFTGMKYQPSAYIAAITAQPEAISVTPASGGNAGTVTLTVHGIGFTVGSALRLEHFAWPAIVGTGVVVAADGTSLSGSLNLAGAPVDTRHVVVAGPDLLTTTLVNAFTIEPVEAPQLRVSVMGPTLQGGNFVVRRDRRTAYDVVIENPGNVDALYVPLWLAGIPTDATVELGFALSYPAQAGGEPNWSTVPLFFTSAGGRYVPLVIPRVPPGRVTRRVFITVPGPVHPPFTLSAAVTPPWVDGNKFRSCIAAGGITNPACMGAQLGAINASMAANPQLLALSGIALWAKVAWQCEGAGSLPAALTKAEQVLDYLEGPVEGGGVGAGCQGVLTTWWREVMGVGVVGAIDPNDKLGAQGTLTGTQALPYTIRFENLPGASAPAQQVVVTDQLDPTKMEMSTVSLDAIRFGNLQIHPPPGLKSYSTRVDLRPGTNLLVDVAASLDPFTHVLSWYFTSIDPATGLVPDNPTVGFLPPNTSPPQGEGSVLFTVMPKSNLSNGTIISNAGSILFDDPPTTNTPTWTNGVDNAPPASHVLPLAGSSHQPSITVSWTADGSPPDLRDFTIYVKEDGGPYRVWRQNTPATSDTLVPPQNHQFHTYSFYSVARDQIGNIEVAPGSSDANTMSTTAVGEPDASTLSLRGAWPNPVVGALRVGLTLSGREAATLELLDVAGRRVMRREVGSLGPGAHVVSLDPAGTLKPGLYFLKLIRGADVLRARVVVVH